MNSHTYCDRTLTWWDMWCESPQAEVFLASDWMRLQMLAQVVDQFFMTGEKTLLAEIRLNEEKLGATVRDRQNLRMIIKKDEVETDVPGREPANVTRLRNAFAKEA